MNTRRYVQEVVDKAWQEMKLKEFQSMAAVLRQQGATLTPGSTHTWGNYDADCCRTGKADRKVLLILWRSIGFELKVLQVLWSSGLSGSLTRVRSNNSLQFRVPEYRDLLYFNSLRSGLFVAFRDLYLKDHHQLLELHRHSLPSFPSFVHVEHVSYESWSQPDVFQIFGLSVSILQKQGLWQMSTPKLFEFD